MEWTQSLELIVAAIGCLSAFLAGLWAFYRHSQRVLRYWRSLSDLHDLYGDDPVKTLAAIIATIETGQGEIELRQRIAERHLKIGVYVCDVNGLCTWGNDVLCDSFGLDSREILGNGWIEAIEESEQQRVIEHWKRCVKDLLPYRESYRVIPAGHDPWHAITKAWPVATTNGRLLCYVGYVIEEGDPHER